MTTATLTSGTRLLTLTLTNPIDAISGEIRNDLSSVKVWISTSSGFTPSDSNLIFNGLSLSITLGGLSNDTLYYVRYAFISDIDPTAYTISSELSQSTIKEATVATAVSIIGVLTNESGTLPADSTGTVISYDGASTTMYIYNNGIDDSNNWTYSATKVNVTCSEASTSRTQTITSITTGKESGYVDITASRSGYSSITKRFDVAKARNGIDGRAYWLVVDTAVLQKNSSGIFNPTSLTINGYTTAGNTSPVLYNGRFKIYENNSITATYTTPTTRDESSVIYTPSSNSVTIIKVEFYLAGGTTTKLDEQTIPVVSDGISGINGAQTHRVYIAGASSSAVISTPSNTTNGGTPPSWSATPVALTGTQAQFQSDGKTAAGSTTTVWSTPYLSYFKVDTLEAITTNTGNLTVSGTFKAGTVVQDSTNNTITTGTAGGVLLSTGNFAFGNSTTNISFDGTALKLNGNIVGASNIVSGAITADKIDSRGLSIKDSAGNIILSAGSSLATSSFAGNVTGFVGGTTASALLNDVTTAQTTANTAQANANTASTTANTASTTANAAQTTANTANTAAAAAQTTANTANSTANAANTAAAAAQSTANAKLAKSGADILTGPISLSAANAILVGTTNDGLYLGNTGIVGRKGGVTTFSVDAAGNATFAGQLSAATGTFSGTLSAVTGTFGGTVSGNVTGSINGTAATTIINNITTAQTTANTASTAASTAQTTANTANTAASTAQTTANTAKTTADTANTAAASAQTTANAANTAAANAQTTANAKLAKSGADILTGPITLSASNAILVGTTNDGLYLGNTGIVGRKAGATTFAVDAAGNATFKGDLTGASGTFTGNLTVGSLPAVSGTTMTGSGGVINSGGTFALGNTTTNIAYNGTALYLNGNIIATGNINANAVSGSDVYNDTSTKVSTAAVGTGYNYFTIATLYFQSYGNKVIIDSKAVCSIWSLTGTSGTQTFQVALFVDGSIVSCASEQKQIAGDATVLPDGSNLSYYQDIPLPMFVFTPDSNVHTYQLKIIYSKTGGAGNYYVAAKNVSLKAVEYKR